jgi:hypothetical protein
MIAACSESEPELEQVTLDTAPDDVLLSVAHALSSADVVVLGRICRSVSAVLRETLARRQAAAVQRVHGKCCECGQVLVANTRQRASAGGCQWAVTLGAHPKLPRPLWTLLGENTRRWRDACLDSQDTAVLMHLLRSRAGKRAALNVPLRIFELDQHPIGCSGVRALLRTLPEAAPALDVLSLDGCGIEDAGACALANAISDGRLRLRLLSLDENPFSTAARQKLRVACRARNIDLSASQAIDNESLWE